MIAQGNALCLTCHNAANPAGLKPGPFRNIRITPPAVPEANTACHMPRMKQTIKDNFVGSHTFRFISPADAAVRHP